MLIFRVGNVYTKVDKSSAPRSELLALHEVLSVKVPNHWFSSKFKMGMWDGYKRFFNLLTATFYTGLLNYAIQRLQPLNIECKVIDERKIATPSTADTLQLHGITLRDYQIKMINAAIKNERGIIAAPPNAGKTEVAAGITKVLGLRTVFFTHRITLLTQTRKRFQMRLERPVGLVGGGIEEWDDITIISVQTAASRLDDIKKHLEDAEVIFIDECHHISGNIFTKIIKLCKNARWRFGLCISGYTKIALANGREIAACWLFKKYENSTLEVLSFNHKTNTIEKKIAKIIKVPFKKHILIFAIKDNNGKIYRLRCSPEHNIYIKDRGYIEAQFVNEGDIVNLLELPKTSCKICGKEIPIYQKLCGKECRTRNWFLTGAKGNKKRLEGMSSEERRSVINWKPGLDKMIETVRTKEFAERQAKRVKNFWMDPSKKEQQDKHRKRSSEQFKKLNSQGLANGVCERRWKNKNKDERRLEVQKWIEAGKKYQWGNVPIDSTYGYYSKGAIANDGHKSASSYEKKVDDWLYHHNLNHGIHPKLPKKNRRGDFLVKNHYIEVDGLNRSDGYFKQKYENTDANYIVLRPNELTIYDLQQKLGFLLLSDPPGIVLSINSCTYRGKGTTLYDLQVEDNNNFFANRILVHNSATALLRDDISNMTVRGLLGDEFIAVTNQELITAGISAFPSVFLLNITGPKMPSSYTFDQVYDEGILYNKQRNDLVIQSAEHFLKQGKNVFILVWRIAHGKLIKEMLDQLSIVNEFISGEDTADRISDVLERFSERELKCVVSSTISDEGLDVPSMDCLIISVGFKAPLKTIQRVGRGLRKKKEGENVVNIVDFVDLHNKKYLYKHSIDRLKTYMNMDIPIFEVTDNDWSKEPVEI